MQGEMERKKKNWVDERGCCGEQRRWERETDCQEVEKPADRDHDEGMDGEGLGMACEKSRVGGGNICSVYLLRSRMHDHNPAAVPRAFSTPRAPPPPLHSRHLPSLCLPPSPRSLLDLRVCCRSSPFVPPTASSPSRCHVAICVASRCSNPSGSGSGCISMLYITAICCIQWEKKKKLWNTKWCFALSPNLDLLRERQGFFLCLYIAQATARCLQLVSTPSLEK